ncbi:uncharacterized protein LOC133497594 isoform X2 [Syngnathoides biaculeatus]|uniref:uncharacterized protein LOC133497594 isoform X2 n=1 Tax=Syngnathoides biaculeatus TaxID=300417 RepID=UPI002ADE86B8|nr:uncharacterized protein LOC133497594 isoform X2 [Syngnathoides biaculeatus]
MCAKIVKEEEYEEEIWRTKEKERKGRDAVSKQPGDVLHTADAGREDLRPAHFKVEEEPWPSRIKREEQEDDISKLPSTGVIVKSEEGDGDRRGGDQSDSLSAPRSDRDSVMSHSSDNDNNDEEEEEEDSKGRL